MKCFYPTIRNVSKKNIQVAKQDVFVKGANRYSLCDCGKCYACRHNRATDWATRSYFEMEDAKNCVFLTLTYNDENLPFNGKVSKRECQLYIKRLRKNLGFKFRYFISSEYGHANGRPHYHALLFGVPYTQRQSKIATIILKSWNKGFIKVGKVNLKTINYVTKYSLKGSSYEDTFHLQSMGYGKAYLNEERTDYHKRTNTRFIVLPYTNGRKRRLPRYYVDRIFTRDDKLRQHYQWITQLLVSEVDRRYNGREQRQITEMDSYLNSLSYLPQANFMDYSTISFISQSTHPYYGLSYRDREKCEQNIIYHYSKIK